MGEPQLASLAVVVAAHQRQTAVSRPKGIFDDRHGRPASRRESPVAAGLSPIFRSVCVTFGWPGSGIVDGGQIEMCRAQRPERRSGHAASFAETGRWRDDTRRMLREPTNRAGSGEERVVVAERAGLFQAASASVVACFLQIRTAQEPVAFGIGRL